MKPLANILLVRVLKVSVSALVAAEHLPFLIDTRDVFISCVAAPVARIEILREH